MKRMIRVLMLAVAFAVFAAPVLAQTAAKECNDETKQALYSKYYDNLTKDSAASYATAKEYLATCPTDDDVYTKALKKFMAKYEAALRKNQLDEAYNKKDYAGVINFGKQVIADDPNNLKPYLLVGYVGNWTFDKDASLASESATYAKKAIEMIEGGKTPENAQGFSKDQALAWLNRSVGLSLLKTKPEEAIPYLLKTVRYESEWKKDVVTYFNLELAYQSGPYKRQSDEYKAKFGGKDETPESKLALENVNQVVDRMIDAYARAAALASGTDKTNLMDALTDLFKNRNNTATGVNELVAGVLAKPVPDIPTPLTSLPTPAATPTPGTSASQPAATNGTSTTQTNKAPGTGTTNPAQPGNKTTTGTARPAPSPSPTPTKPPGRPKARANHSGRG